jgi:hypothetical protein
MVLKIFCTPDCFIDGGIIKEHFNLVSDLGVADIILSGSFPEQYIPMEKIPINKLCFSTSEVPLCTPRVWWYSQFSKMPLVVCYNPLHENEIPLTKDNKWGAHYPYPLVPLQCEEVFREDTTMKNRSMFQAGELGLESLPDVLGNINIRILRRQFTEWLLKRGRKDYVIGSGTTHGNTFLPNNLDVRMDKQDNIKFSDCDFVLALENSIYPDYITEKIGEGFTSDRVTLYLGAPNIENHVPLNCFIDLRKWFNVETKVFNFNGLEEYLDNITQEEYDQIIKNAREFRKNSREKFFELKYDLTQRVVERLHKIKKEREQKDL